MSIFLKSLLLENDKSVSDIQRLAPEMVRVAQEAYDQWEQDEEGMDDVLGGGGICQDIAEAISGVLSEHGVEAMTVDNQGMGEQHVWTVARVQEGVFGVDIDYRKYETGGGYSWKKKQGVMFRVSDIEIYPLKGVKWEDLENGY